MRQQAGANRRFNPRRPEVDEFSIDTRKWVVGEVLRQMTNDFTHFLTLQERWYVAYVFSDYVKDEIAKSDVAPAELPALPVPPALRLS